MKQIRNNDNREPWETQKNNSADTIIVARGWQKVFKLVILCAMLALAALTIWGVATGEITSKGAADLPTAEAEESTTRHENPQPGEDLTYEGIALGPEFLGNANIGGGSGIGSKPYEYPFTLAEVLETKGKVPTLELLQKNRAPYVYDEDGNEIALFAVIGVITDQDDVDFDTLRLTDACVASCRPIKAELPATVYLDKAKTVKLVMFNNSLYLVSGNEAENASANRYDWQIFGADATSVTLSDGTIERVNGQTFGHGEGITYKPGEKPTVRN